MMTYDYSRDAVRVAVGAVEEDDKFLELEAADYITFLLALDTYHRWVKESGRPQHDPVLIRGLTLLRMAERDHLDKVGAVIRDGVKNPASLTMLAAALRLPPTHKGASIRALKLRTILSRGGPTTVKHVFGSSTRARREVNDAIESSMGDDAATAFSKFSTIVLKDKRLQGWIARAAASTASGGEPLPVETSIVHEASKQVGESADELLKAKAQQDAHPPTSEAHAEASRAQATILNDVQRRATEAAAQALATTGEPDVPPTRSEVVGIVTAAVTAAMAEPDSPALAQALNVGGYPLDPEQRAAALTDGRVLVAAGAGAGKSTTLVGRLKYLLQVKHESPSRILVATFNTKAAEDLKETIGKELGSVGDSVACGTMHKLFRNFIGCNGKKGFGTPAEQQALSDGSLIAEERSKGKGKRDEEEEPGFVIEGDEGGEVIGAPRQKVKAPTPRQMTAAVRGVIKDIGPGGLAEMTGLPEKLFALNPLPSAKICNQFKENWSGNDVDSRTALQGAETVEEVYSAVWSRIYAGLKGDLGPSWSPVRPSNAFNKFMRGDGRHPGYRPDGRRLCDLNDMVLIFRDILKRNPEARKAAQDMFDHVLVDEAQDLNVVQHDIFEMMTEQVQPGSGKSFWVVGDDKQAIYQFRGARPGLFTALNGKENWTTRLIKTNYRCDPEIVEAANKVTAHNEGQIPMVAQADPKKSRGKASISVAAPPSYVDIAGDVIESFEKKKAVDPNLTWNKGFAVLSRTNNELNSFEDQCIIHEIPYKRSRNKGFLESKESNTVLGYMDLALSSDNETLQTALVNTINKPDRGLYLGDEAIEKILREAYRNIAHADGIDIRNFNPLDALTRGPVARKVAMALKEPLKGAKIAAAKRLENQYGSAGWLRDKMRTYGYEWMWYQDVEELATKLMEMGQQVLDLRKTIKAGVKTPDLLRRILEGIKTEVGFYNKKTGQDSRRTVTLQQQIKEDIAFTRNPDDDEAPEAVEKQVRVDENGTRQVVDVDPATGEVVDPLLGMGTVRYLFDIAKPNDNDKALNVDPTQADGFYRKMDRYKEVSKKLQDPNLNPDRLTLSTVHSVKGAQWDHVALCCSYGFFPANRADKSTLLESQLEKLGEKIPWDSATRAEAVEKAHAHIEDPMTSERNLAYVGITRAKTDLEVICSQERVSPRDKGSSGAPILGKFIKEAELTPGQNVKVAPAEAPPVEEPPPEVLPEVKLAFVSDDEEVGRYLPNVHSYDRRMP